MPEREHWLDLDLAAKWFLISSPESVVPFFFVGYRLQLGSPTPTFHLITFSTPAAGWDWNSQNPPQFLPLIVLY
jgi:hypothetical protein